MDPVRIHLSGWPSRLNRWLSGARGPGRAASPPRSGLQRIDEPRLTRAAMDGSWVMKERGGWILICCRELLLQCKWRCDTYPGTAMLDRWAVTWRDGVLVGWEPWEKQRVTCASQEEKKVTCNYASV
ncbi:hypothetical protein PAHAL_1G298200 [Panicum hallii]|uniref:Uncharacterized protein n=1 Tax=Panicum hallii TaxID=206008 RepID=A0A2S3GR55_9POAL|nr:hypothetical protein PAHAL_1G298200 [Panicum hallii]